MKKALILLSMLLLTSVSLWAQDEDSNVKHLTYKGFLKEIWDFEKHPDDFVYKGKTAAIVDFYATWCGPCRKVSPILEQLAKEYEGQLNVYKINVDEERDLASAFQITSIPAFLFIPQEGQPMMHKGFLPETEFKKIIGEHLLPQPK